MAGSSIESENERAYNLSCKYVTIKGTRKMRKKKSGVIAGLLLAAMMTVTACGSQENNANSTSGSSGNETQTTNSNEPMTITAIAQATIAQKPGFEAAVKKVEELASIKLEVTTYPDDQFLNTVKTKLATGDSTDLIFHPYGAYDIPSDLLEPLDGPWASKISDSTKPFTLWKDKIVKAPYGGQTNMGLIYNKKVLEAAGVKLPMKNFAEFTAAMEAIKKTGVTPFYLPNKENWTAQIIYLSSMTGVLMNTEGLVDKLATNKVKPQDVPTLLKLWENGEEIKKKGFLNEDYMSADKAMAEKAVAEGKAAFFAGLDSFYGDFQKDYPDAVKDLGMTTTPMWDDEKDGFVMTDPSGFFISMPAKAENKDAAKKFIDTFLTQPVLTAYYDLVPGSVPYKDLGYELKQNDWNKEMQGYAALMPSYGDWANSVYDGEPKLNPMWGDFNLQQQNMFAGKSAKDAMTDWYNKYSTDAKAKGFEGF